MTKVRAALRRWMWLITLGAFAGFTLGVISVAFQKEQKQSYQSTSMILFDLNRSSSAAQEAAQQAGLRVKRGGVPLRAAQILGESDPEALIQNLDVEVDGDSLALIIRVNDVDQNHAVAVADAFTTAFLESSNEQEMSNLDNQISLLERRLAVAEQRLKEFDAANPVARTLTDPGIPVVRERTTLLDDATTLTQELDDTRQRRESTTGPYSRLGQPTVAEASGTMLALPKAPPLRIALLTLLGFGLAVMLVALLERINPRIDSKEEAEEVTGLPVLSMVPFVGRRDRRLVESVEPDSFGGGHGEAYRRLRSAIQFISSKNQESSAEDQPRGQSFLIVSSSPNEGKTSTVAFTAFALAEADVPTVAINADCRRPTLHERLGVAPEPGLSNLAEYDVNRPGIDEVIQTGPISDLWVLASGRPGPLTTEMTGVIAEAVDVATDRGATVIVDSSPLLATTDVLELVPLVDWVIMVIRNGRTTRHEAAEGLEMLRMRGAPLLGCICVGSNATKRRYSYYEDYYYYDSSRSAPPETPETPETPDRPVEESSTQEPTPPPGSDPPQPPLNGTAPNSPPVTALPPPPAASTAAPPPPPSPPVPSRPTAADPSAVSGIAARGAFRGGDVG